MASLPKYIPFETNLNLRNESGEYNLLAELLSDKNNIPFIFVKFQGENKASISERSDYGYGCILTTYGKIKNRLQAENICISDTTVRPRKDTYLFDFDCVNEAILNAIENFGSMTIMCSDKTGTITKGKVKLDKALDFNGEESDSLEKFAAINSYFQEGYKNPIDEAILSSNKVDFSSYKKLFEIPYSFENKLLSIMVKAGTDFSNKNLMVTKGAFENIVEISNSYQKSDGSIGNINEIKSRIFDLFDDFSSKGYRVLGLSYKELSDDCNFQKQKAEGMIFKGFLLFIDPLKEDIKDVIEQMNTLGVSLKMITGDNKEIAKNIGGQIGLNPDKILLGEDLSSYSISQLNKKVLDIDIFAEISPNQKEKIIRAYKEAGEIVGYMGDGINDAPAIKQADVGISVDTAADTAKDAASIVLLQNSLEVLLSGIKEGRRTFINTLKYIFVATSANFGNMFSMAGASLFLKFLPLLPKQILLTNLFTDFPSLQIASDSVDYDWLKSPVKWDMKFIKKFMIVFGITSSIFDYLTFFIMMIFFKADEKLFQTTWMLESVISAMVVMLIVRTARPVFKSKASKKLIVSIIAVSICLIEPYQQLLRPNCITYQGTNRYAFYIPNLRFSCRNNEENIL